MPLERAPHCESLVAEVFTDLGLPTPPVAAFWGPLPTAPYPLDPVVEADTTTMSMRRKLGFSAGREAARQAQVLLGCDPVAVPIGAGGAPMWPAGITGSLSHSDHLVCAVIVVEPSDQPDQLSIGIDIEQLGRIDDDLVATIMTERELREWAALNPAMAQHRATTTFSLKEALYKAQYPLTGQWLGFDHIEVEPSRLAPSFRAALSETPTSPLGPVVRRPLRGRCRVLEDHVLSAVVLQGV